MHLASEQALQGAAGREKEGELVTTSLEFEYLHRKSRCEMLIGGNDISNDVITPWHVFFNVRLHSHSFQLRADWRKTLVKAQSTGSYRGIGGGIQISAT